MNGLRATEAVGRLGTLQAAAEELGVSVGAVSQQLIRTEKALGRAVFAREGRGMKATAFGATFLARLTEGFRTLDDALAAAQRRDDAILTVSVAPVFASKWLVPRLTAWSTVEPGILVRIDASTRLVDPDASDVDLAIRVGAGNWPGVRAEFLLPQEVFPVCAPALAERLRTPADLVGVPIVRDANSNLSWNIWLARHGLDETRLSAGNAFTDAALCLDAAIAGQGVMLGWQTLADYALRHGQLVAPFPDRAATGLGYYLVTSATRREPRKVARFKEWLRAEVSASVPDAPAPAP